MEKDKHYTLENVELILITIIECAIDKLYHTGATVMGATGLEQLTAPQIISHMQLNYGVPGIGEIKKALLCLNEPMDSMISPRAPSTTPNNKSERKSSKWKRTNIIP